MLNKTLTLILIALALLTIKLTAEPQQTTLKDLEVQIAQLKLELAEMRHNQQYSRIRGLSFKGSISPIMGSEMKYMTRIKKTKTRWTHWGLSLGVKDRTVFRIYREKAIVPNKLYFSEYFQPYLDIENKDGSLYYGNAVSIALNKNILLTPGVYIGLTHNADFKVKTGAEIGLAYVF